MRTLAIFLSAALGACALQRAVELETLVLDPTLHHLGDDRAGWPDAPTEPEGPHLALSFVSPPNQEEWTLLVRQRDVDDRWTVRLDGRPIAELRRRKDDRTIGYRVPPGAIASAGRHELVFEQAQGTDDCVLGEIRLVKAPLERALGLGRLTVEVIEKGSDRPLPARITIVPADDPTAARPELYDAGPAPVALRAGIAYVLRGRLDARLPAGSWRIYASRGTEWSALSATATLTPGNRARIVFPLVREVDTTGFVAADTHIHTYTFSGHGDATVEERMVTLAGEGVEFAVATDHNHNTDYRPVQEAVGANEHFTPVTGNEVTTKVGHFNAFPLDPHDRPPNAELTDWVRLVDEMRAHGARVVILNHPRWPDVERGPFGRYGLDRRTGAFADGRTLTVDAIELVNSCWLLDDARLKLQDWFALLDRGVDVAVVGASDSHTVGEPVGQGRTYVASSTDDPADLDVEEICESFLRRRSSVSLGIFVDARLEGRPLGSTVRAEGDHLELELDVRAPSFVRPLAAEVYLNGVKVAQRDLEPPAEGPTDVTLSFALPRPEHDAYVVAFVAGDGVDLPCWPTMKPYTLAATQPFRVDADRDGVFLWPRETALELLPRRPDSAVEWRRLLAPAAPWDRPILVHLVDLALGIPHQLEQIAPLAEEDGLDAEALRYLRDRLRR